MKIKLFLLPIFILLSVAGCTAEKQEPIIGKWWQLGDDGPSETFTEFLPNSILIHSYKGAKAIETGMGEWKKVSDTHYVLSFKMADIPLVVHWKEIKFSSDSTLSATINGKSYSFIKSEEANQSR